MEWPAHLPLVRGGGVSVDLINYDHEIIRVDMRMFAKSS